jgi:hypothetical protein
MAPQPPIAATGEDRHGRILAELAGLSLMLCRDLQARALAAETTEEAAKLARAFQTTARGLRQTLALDLKVIRYRDEVAKELAKAEAARAADAERPLSVRAPDHFRRRDTVATQVERLIYSETEGEELDDAAFDARCTRLQNKLNDWLELAVERPDFLREEVDRQIAEACQAIGVDPARLAAFADDDDDDEGYDEYEDFEDEGADLETLDHAGAPRTPAGADSS